MTDDEVGLVIARMAAEWPTRFRAPKGAAVVWAEELEDLDYRQVVAAIKLHAAQPDSWPPSPTALRAQLLATIDPDLPPPADAALAEVQAKIRSVGSGGPNWTLTDRTTPEGSPYWSHPAVGAAVDAMGGWLEVCGHDNPEAFRAHFLRIYDAATRRERAMASLTSQDRGILEMARNAIKRLDAPEVPHELPQRA